MTQTPNAVEALHQILDNAGSPEKVWRIAKDALVALATTPSVSGEREAELAYLAKFISDGSASVAGSGDVLPMPKWFLARVLSALSAPKAVELSNDVEPLAAPEPAIETVSADTPYRISQSHAERLSSDLRVLRSQKCINENDWSVLVTLVKQAAKPPSPSAGTAPEPATWTGKVVQWETRVKGEYQTLILAKEEPPIGYVYAPEPSAASGRVAAQVHVGTDSVDVCPMTHGAGDWLRDLKPGTHDLVLAYDRAASVCCEDWEHCTKPCGPRQFGRSTIPTNNAASVEDEREAPEAPHWMNAYEGGYWMKGWEAGWQARAALSKQPAGESRWIAVEERMPEKNTEVLIAFRDAPLACTGQYTASPHDTWGWCFPSENDPEYTGPITHWMPAPDHPHEDRFDRKQSAGEQP